MSVQATLKAKIRFIGENSNGLNHEDNIVVDVSNLVFTSNDWMNLKSMSIKIPWNKMNTELLVYEVLIVASSDDPAFNNTHQSIINVYIYDIDNAMVRYALESNYRDECY